jgi:hypothetical protein
MHYTKFIHTHAMYILVQRMLLQYYRETILCGGPNLSMEGLYRLYKACTSTKHYQRPRNRHQFARRLPQWSIERNPQRGKPKSVNSQEVTLSVAIFKASQDVNNSARIDPTFG